MFNIFSNQKSGNDVIPANLTTLGISWLNNQFKAVAVHHGMVEGTWECPNDTDGLSQFETLLREAVEKTSYHGTTVTLLLRHPQLLPVPIDAPPVSGTALHKVIERQAQLQKTFPGQPAWAYEPAFPAKSSPRGILHLFPRQLLNLLITGCQRNGLHLTAVMPSSAVLRQQLGALSLEREDVALIAAETGGYTTVVVGRGDGQLLLVRTLTGTWNDNTDRLATDLNRTRTFIEQQYGLSINRGAWLFGPGAAEQIRYLQGPLELPVAVSPVVHNPFYWAIEALKLRPAVCPNFIGRELQQAPRRQVFAKVVAAATAFIFLAAVVASVLFLRQARLEDANIRTLRAQLARLQDRRQLLQDRNEQLQHQQKVVQLIIDGQLPPVPGWFLGYLGEAVPDELVVTGLHIKREDDTWKVQLTGSAQPGSKPLSSVDFSNSVASLVAHLTDGPFHLTLDNNNPAGTAPRFQVSWKSPADNQFVVEGAMR
jgi:hypothetical protein